MKVSAEDLRSKLGEDRFVFICSTSFESRWYKAVSHMNANLIEKLIVVNQGGGFPEIEKGNKLIGLAYSDAPEKLSYCELNGDDAIEKAKKLKGLLTNIEPSNKILIDITTFTHENLLIFYQFIDQIKNKENIKFIYTGAQEYSTGLPDEEKWLSRGVKNIRSVFGYPGIMYPSQKTHLIILAGFEYERAEKLIKEIEPSIISIGVAKSNSHFAVGHKDVNNIFIERLNEFISTIVHIKSSVEIFEFSCSDPYETKRAIDKQVYKHVGYNIVLCPMNTKVSTLGAGMAAARSGEERIQICYVEPIEYNSQCYSSSGNDISLITAFDDSVTGVGELIRVSNDGTALSKLKSLNVSPVLIEAFSKADAIRTELGSDDERTDKFIRAAEAFAGVAESVRSHLGGGYVQGNGDQLLYLYSKMNEALCYMLLKEHQKAFDQYHSLLDRFNEFPILFHRLGQVVSRLGKYSSAIDYFEKSLDLVLKYEKNDVINSDEMPAVDYEHLKEHTPLLLGYQYWVKSTSDSTLSQEKKMSLLRLAYKRTLEVAQYQKANQNTLREAHNNSLYYLIELSLLDATLKVDAEHVGIIKSHLNALDSLYLAEQCMDIDILDTLAKAKEYLGDVKMALHYANRIIEIGEGIADANRAKDPSIASVLRDATIIVKSYTFQIDG